VNVILSDVLEVDVVKLLGEKKLVPTKTLVVGNLPYYITSPILRKFFTGDDLVFPGGIFLVQKEVAEKIMTSAKKKSFLLCQGRLFLLLPK
jgi:16S rRNA (adenine1518-N6/adenine1519-N6)-dimethyltransferase